MGHYEIATRWMDKALGKTTKGQLAGSNVYARGDKIYSYGSHFEMARVMRDKKGAPTAVLQNGDVWGPTTTRHQGMVRGIVAHSGLPTVIIPHSALQAAGINLDSIQIVDASPDRNETRQWSSTYLPEGAKWITEDVHANVALSPEELDALVDKKNAKALEEWERKVAYAADEKEDGYWKTQWLPGNRYAPEPMGEWALESWHRHDYRKVGTRTFLRIGGYTEVALEEGVYRWETHHHWLGESLVTGSIKTPRWTPCKACKAKRVDWNASPTTWATETRTLCLSCNGNRGKHSTVTRTAFFLSGFDHAERRPLYFLCELPKGAKPASIAEAYEALKPEAVVLAEGMGRTVTRQGDIFAIQLSTGTSMRTLRKNGATFAKRGNLLATNHEASEVGYLPDGTTVARGILYHNPSGRDPDHGRRKLAPGWNVIIKNTVPTNKKAR